MQAAIFVLFEIAIDGDEGHCWICLGLPSGLEFFSPALPSGTRTPTAALQNPISAAAVASDTASALGPLALYRLAYGYMLRLAAPRAQPGLPLQRLGPQQPSAADGSDDAA